MADNEKPVSKPFSAGILSQTNGKPAETIQRSYVNEAEKERSRVPASDRPFRRTKTKG